MAEQRNQSVLSSQAEVKTFGCRLNAYESEVIRRNLSEAGRKNVTVFNTCAVTKEAERQAKQAIRRHHRKHPEQEIIVTGCAAQISPESYAAIDGVSQVIGNEEKMRPDSYRADGLLALEKVRVNDIMSITETASHLITSMEGQARAFMQIQNGCNHRCTFCIIPFGRGNSRSVGMGEVIAQGNLLVEQGFNEIVLTGVDLTDYGKDLPGEPTLGQLVKRFLAAVPVARLRLSSVDVAEIDGALLDVLANEPRFMPHFHISLQAGDDMVLKRMKRRHSRQQVLDFVKQCRHLRPETVFGGDIIAGFPTETEAMFENTLHLVSEAGLMHLHIFPYSEREGTPAANIPASRQVPVPVRKERARLLREAGERELAAHVKQRAGQEERVLVERGGVGHSEQFLPVTVPEDWEIGSIRTVRTQLKDDVLVAG